jgi:carbonic anhydrase/acetyltransferase-like protein (isoleucine patch superfamily)
MPVTGIADMLADDSIFTEPAMPITRYLDTFPDLGKDVFLHPSAQVIGNVQIGDDSSVWCNAVLRGDVNAIRIGRCSNIQDLTMGHVTNVNPTNPRGAPLIVGDFVTVGHSVILHGCMIGNHCLIGMGTIVMDNVTIGDNVMVGAGSLVPPGKTLDSGFLYTGRPVRRVRALSPADIAQFRMAAEHYMQLKGDYMKHAGQTSR